MSDPFEDTGLFVLRIMLILAFGAICFMAGRAHERSLPTKIPNCVEQPAKQASYPKTKKEMAAFIQYYSNRGM